MKRSGIPLTRESYRFQNWFGTPPDYISAEEQAEIDEALEEVEGAPEKKGESDG
jgi:hypothetical protein